MAKIILASASPRRLEILKMAGYNPDVRVSDVDENIEKCSPAEMVEELAKRKNAVISSRDDEIVLSADTVVAVENEILGKPKSSDDAERMLRALSGKKHTVYSGYCIRLKEKLVSGYVAADVYMRQIKENELKAYVLSGEGSDKAGAYAIQGGAGKFVSKIDGDYYAIVGLPICKISEILNEEFNCFAEY